ncbi:MAG TPA: sigma-54 dependent transcriptional regulator [Steroidobacteraceae bacterium]|jgi:DNA-binding NtrC family response regulator|nr:sigma-54 dependent transcriptional regulator [Steroidobacteraceae bacterium]
MSDFRSDPPRVIVADDQQDVLTALRLLLKNDGMQVTTVSSPAGLLEAVRSETFDVALIDLNYTRDTTSGREGLDLLPQLHAIDGTLPVIVMTAWGTIDVAVEAMRRGARDFLEKPWDNHRVLALVRNQASYSREVRKGRRLEAENQLLRAAGDEDFIAEAPAMRAVLDTVERIAPSDASVLITGENGTGKGLIARFIHKRSLRAAKPFISVNMGSIPETVFESEMMGHVRGAFTDAKADRVGRFELADGGTLFMDEIGNVPISQQAKLLRIIESGEFERVGSSRTQRANVRIVAATNANLAELVAQGRFRQDLLFRLNTIEVRLPPLRERREDIVPIAYRRLAALAAKYGRRIEGFDDGALQLLRTYTWPGNVRELGNVIERAVLMARGASITAADLRLDTAVPTPAPSIEAMSLEDAERLLIRTALRRAEGNVNAAAEALGLSRSAMYRRLEKLGIRTDGQ